MNLIVTTNTGNVSSRLIRIPVKFNQLLIKILKTTGLEMRSFIQNSMRTSPPNKSIAYRRQGTKYNTKASNRKNHYPSLPGNPPRPDSGRLINSIIMKQFKNGIEVGYISEGKEIIKYAKMLEEGSSKVEARPFIAPCFEKYNPIIENRIMNAIKESIIK